MHVGLITTSFPLPDNAVSGVFVARLAEHLCPNIQLTVLTPSGVSPLPAARKSKFALRCFRYAPQRWQLIAHQPGGIPVALGRRPWLVFLLPTFLLGMCLACWGLARRVDLLHANWAAPGAIAGVIGVLTSTPVITTLRGSDVTRLERSLLQRFLLSVCMRTNMKVVCVSEAIAAKAAESVTHSQDKLTVVPNGVDEKFLNIERKQDVSKNPPLTLVSIGNLTLNKATHVAIEALNLIADVSKTELTIVGDGPERESIRRLVESYELNGQVQLLGQIENESIPALLTRADALVLTSRAEGRPNVVLEAMAASLPVVATKIPGITELVRNGVTGLLFEPDDASALADCILRLERDPELCARLGRAGRAFIQESGLLWGQTATAYLDIYRAACREFRS